MYKIINIKDNLILGRTENVTWIKKNSNTGCFIQAKSAKEAEGIAFNSIAYNLYGLAPINTDEDALTVKVIEIDAGIDIDRTESALAETNATLDNIIISMLNE